MIAPGEAAPALSLPDQDGQVQTLMTLRGARGLVLLFYRGYW